MPSYVVFEIWDRGEQKLGRLKTGVTAIAAFRAADGEKACQAVAAATKKLTNYIAIEGTLWGIDMAQVDGAEELGLEQPEESKLERRIRELERANDIGVDHDQ